MQLSGSVIGAKFRNAGRGRRGRSPYVQFARYIKILPAVDVVLLCASADTSPTPSANIVERPGPRPTSQQDNLILTRATLPPECEFKSMVDGTSVRSHSHSPPLGRPESAEIDFRYWKAAWKRVQ